MQTATLSPLPSTAIRLPTGLLIHSFPDILPIRFIAEALARGQFSRRDSFVTYENVRMSLMRQRAETVYLACFGGIIEDTELMGIILSTGKSPCPPNYLLGLLMKIPEEHMPPELLGKDLVAAGPPDSDIFVFHDRCGQPSFLSFDRDKKPSRGIGLTPIIGNWGANWAYALMDKPPD